jgi:hypothetical protein
MFSENLLYKVKCLSSSHKNIILGVNCSVQVNFPWQVMISATVTDDFIIVLAVKYFNPLKPTGHVMHQQL